jgi:hypothetical protein
MLRDRVVEPELLLLHQPQRRRGGELLAERRDLEQRRRRIRLHALEVGAADADCGHDRATLGCQDGAAESNGAAVFGETHQTLADRTARERGILALRDKGRRNDGQKDGRPLLHARERSARPRGVHLRPRTALVLLDRLDVRAS